MIKWILKQLAICLVKYLQKRYRNKSERWLYKQTNQHTNQLILIQSILYFFKIEFSAWGYFHPSCIWTNQDEIEFRKLFPEKKFKELEIVVCRNPESMNYYHNEIFRLQRNNGVQKFMGGVDYHAREIKKQLKEWNKWN